MQIKLTPFYLFLILLIVLVISMFIGKWSNEGFKEEVSDEPFVDFYRNNNEYGEKMVWVGKTTQYESFIALYKNIEKGTWTMVQYDGRLACVIGSGETGTPI